MCGWGYEGVFVGPRHVRRVHSHTTRIRCVNWCGVRVLPQLVPNVHSSRTRDSRSMLAFNASTTRPQLNLHPTSSLPPTSSLILPSSPLSPRPSTLSSSSQPSPPHHQPPPPFPPPPQARAPFTPTGSTSCKTTKGATATPLTSSPASDRAGQARPTGSRRTRRSSGLCTDTSVMWESCRSTG